ncbi:MFS general substrate transporter [Lecanosticta acicola]|uniref:MFS general substrate transporter n=1 Tax=Lecanosticta acicola TaxID=111012 RepID=A0AAI8YV02_9PEZI|nr:MFS general substrate transporter [Lecanosticta acicola]
MDPHLYQHPSPLEGYENLDPLSNDRNPQDGKSLLNPTPTTTPPSTAYQKFPSPIHNGPLAAGFDIHIYFLPSNPTELAYATALHERIRREFPELRIYELKPHPIGPHPVGMFEVNLFTPAQFGAFVSWLVIWRGPLSALIHPNTGSNERDHTQRATWMGQPYPLQTWMLRKLDEKNRQEATKGNGTSAF